MVFVPRLGIVLAISLTEDGLLTTVATLKMVALFIGFQKVMSVPIVKPVLDCGLKRTENVVEDQSIMNYCGRVMDNSANLIQKAWMRKH